MFDHRLVCIAASAATIVLSGCDDLDSKARKANEAHEAARQEVKATLLPMAAKSLPAIAPVTIDVRVDEAGKVTKCLSNRQELPGCVGTVLKGGESSSFSFSTDEVAQIRAGDGKLKETPADAPK